MAFTFLVYTRSKYSVRNFALAGRGQRLVLHGRTRWCNPQLPTRHVRCDAMVMQLTAEAISPRHEGGMDEPNKVRFTNGCEQGQKERSTQPLWQLAGWRHINSAPRTNKPWLDVLEVAAPHCPAGTALKSTLKGCHRFGIRYRRKSSIVQSIPSWLLVHWIRDGR